MFKKTKETFSKKELPGIKSFFDSIKVMLLYYERVIPKKDYEDYLEGKSEYRPY